MKNRKLNEKTDEKIRKGKRGENRKRKGKRGEKRKKERGKEGKTKRDKDPLVCCLIMAMLC